MSSSFSAQKIISTSANSILPLSTLSPAIIINNHMTKNAKGQLGKGREG
jgi:hypothetical protein